VPDASIGSLQFPAQIAFFRKKLALPTDRWDAIWKQNHDHAFVVAGAMRQNLVEDFQTAVQKAIKKGTSLKEFQHDFDNIVAKHGWDYHGSRDWRSELIYTTNLRTSHAAGRFEQLQSLPYWQYHHSISVTNPRPEHQGWDGLVLAKDDPFWQTHYAPNGWGCRCYVTGLSKARMKMKGLTVSESPTITTRPVKVGKPPNQRVVDVPNGIDAGWDYAPGRDAWMKQATAKPLTSFDRGSVIPNLPARDLLPAPRPMSSSVLLPPMATGQESTYVKKFLDVFDADIGKPALFADAIGEAVVVADDLFRNHQGAWKIGKRGREQHLLLLADALHNPDEIWAWLEWHQQENRAVARRLYISRYTIDGVTHAAMVIMGRGEQGWYGITAHETTNASEFNQKVERNRRGVRLFKRT